MNFNGLPGGKCGQLNSIEQLTNHATQDLAFQESVSNPHNSGLEQDYPMPPQSFQLDDLMRELQIEAPLADYAQTPSWERELQTQFQSQNFQARNEMLAEAYEENPFRYGNLQNLSTPYFQCHVPQNYDAIFPQTEYEFQDQHQSEESDPTEKTGEEILIDEAGSDKNNNEICRPLERIVEFDDPQKFSKYLELLVTKYRKQQWEIKNPTKKFEDGLSKKILLDDTIRYFPIKNNSYRNHSNPYVEGCEALNEEDWMKAVLYFDEAIRQDNTDTLHWFGLSFALIMSDNPVLSLFAIKELLRLDPGCIWGNITASHIYHMFDCDYQACQSIFNWLKYNAKYNFLIPEDFEMNAHSNSTKLERYQFKAVLDLFCKAARQNPTGDIDELLQVNMSELLNLSGEFEKRIDCIRTALLTNPTDVKRFIDLGSALFHNGDPYQALNAYMSAFEHFKSLDKDIHTIISLNKTCTCLGVVHMYLKNYKQANNCFMRVITRNYDFEIDGRCSSLEAEYDLCLNLYLKVTDMVK